MLATYVLKVAYFLDIPGLVSYKRVAYIYKKVLHTQTQKNASV